MVDQGARFGVIRLRGGRYERPGLPLAAGAELARYEALLGRVARSLYMHDHSRRSRVPRGFAQAIELRLTAVETGSVIPVLERHDASLDTLPEVGDYYDTARVVINEALTGLNSDAGKLSPRFPPDCLKDFAAFGRSLQDDESIEFGDDADSEPAVLRVSTRRRIQELARSDHFEVERVLVGQVTGLRSSPQQFDFLLPTGRTLNGSFANESTWSELRDFQGYADRAPMAALTVVAQQATSGELGLILDVLNVEAALPPEWAERMEQIAGLQRGWLYSEAEAPTPAALDVAEQLLLACAEEAVERPGIYPRPDGGVQLEWQGHDSEVEIQISALGVIAALWVAKDSDDEREADFTVDDLDAVLDFVRGGLR